MTKYILVTDLHLSQATEDVVFDILEYVYAREEPNVIILGDFWDQPYATGTIDGRLVNRCLTFFAKQVKQTYIIPGNHDYFGPDDEDHALVCFTSVMTVISSAKVVEGMLFLPYRKEGYSRVFLRRMKREGVHTVFSHLDIKATFTRRGRLSVTGMDIDSFQGMTVYNGHYHYPSSSENIHCIGSHYCITANESHDKKYMWIVDRAGFVKVPVHFGRRTFSYSLKHLQDAIKSKWTGHVMPRPGDTIVLENEETDLQLEGVNIVTRRTESHKNMTLHMDDWKGMIVQASNQLFADEVEIENSTHQEISSGVLDVIEGLPVVESCKKPIHLEFHRIQILNFCGISCYDLKFEEGVTFVQGANGSGKTMRFVSAALYCLSGILEERFSGKPVYADLDSGAQVCLTGTKNGISFRVHRSYLNGKTDLQFTFNDQTMMYPTLKRIQKEINYCLCNLSTGGSPNHAMYTFLRSTVFFCQKHNTTVFTKFDDMMKRMKGEEKNLRNTRRDFEKRVRDLEGEISLKKERHFIESSGLASFEAYRETELVELYKQLHEITDPGKPEISEEARKYQQRAEVLLAQLPSHTFEHYCGLTEFRKPEKFNNIKHRYQYATFLSKLTKNQIHSNACPVCSEPSQNLSALRRKIDAQRDTAKHLKAIFKEFKVWKLQRKIWLVAMQFNDEMDGVEGWRHYLSYLQERATVKAKIDALISSKEGLYWTPEKVYKEILDVESELRVEQLLLAKVEDDLKNTLRALKCLSAITAWFTANMTVEVSTTMSGGEYEEAIVKGFLKYRRYVKEWEFWSTNLLILDEPGPHMDLKRFLKMVPTMQAQSTYIITHKTVKEQKSILL